MNGTKQRLADSLRALLSQKPFQKITVRELAEHCGVHRMTFYYHFQDMYDLAGWIVRQETMEILRQKKLYAGHWTDGYLAALRRIQANRPLVMNAIRSDGGLMQQLLLELSDALLPAAIREEAAGLQVPEEAEKKLTAFYRQALLGITLDWIAAEMQPSPQEMADTVKQITRGALRSALLNLGCRPLPPEKGSKTTP